MANTSKQRPKVRVEAEAVFRLIAQRNISQNELARELGVSGGYMSQLVCGRRHPSPRLRRRMLDFFGCARFEDLFVVEGCARGSGR